MHWHRTVGLAIYKYNLRRSEINYSLSRATFSLSEVTKEGQGAKKSIKILYSKDPANPCPEVSLR